MPRLSLWKGLSAKTNDYKFMDRIVSQQYKYGGIEFYIHKYIGVYKQDSNGNDIPVDLDKSEDSSGILVIQDVLNMENRDRRYDPDVYGLKGHYLVTDNEFNLSQFGLFLTNDTLFITFHLNDMVDQFGRKIMAGDVIEVLNQRDDLILGNGTAINKFYVVEEATKPAEGYGPSWWPHMWRVKCSPMPQSSEYQDILNKPVEDASGDPIPKPDGSGDYTTIDDAIGTRNDLLSITNAIVAEATLQTPFRYFQSQHFYILPNQNPYYAGKDIWTGAGIPPNGSKPVPAGTSWPENPLIGDYFLRYDYTPPQLFERTEFKWKRIQTAWRNTWNPGTNTLVSFINNSNTTVLDDGTTVQQQQNIRTTMTPKLDPDII